MKKINIHVNRKQYEIICDADQIDHVRQLAAEIDERVQRMASAAIHADDARLLILTSLMLADELYEARQEAGALREKQILSEEGLHELLQSDALSGEQQRISELMDMINDKMETLTMKLEQS